MHEMSIAASLIEHVLEVGRQQRATRIAEVELQVGVLQLIVPEALELAFSAVTEGTPAEGAIRSSSPGACSASWRRPP